jgi:methionyl-tRNA formyltransferase
MRHCGNAQRLAGMEVLLLGPSDSPLVDYLRAQGDTVVAASGPIDAEILARDGQDFIVCYGYRHILGREVVRRYRGRAVNLHISYLPWNRGADPNLWSFVEDSPKGVTLHYIDEGVDTGDIIAQTPVAPVKGDTLRTSYDRLQRQVRLLFEEYWPAIRAGTCPRLKQAGAGSSHRLEDRERLAHLLTDGWDTPVAALERLRRGGPR